MLKSQSSDITGIDDQQQMLLQKQTTARDRLLYKRLKILTLLNVITFFVFVFAMVVDRWVWISMEFNINFVKIKKIQFWANLLYMKQENGGAIFETFTDAGTRFCQHDILCLSRFDYLYYVGSVSFAVIVLAVALQLFDFCRLLFLIKNKVKLIQNTQYFRHIFTILTYLIGITLSAFGTVCLQAQDYEFGLCFWTTVITLFLFVSILLYEQFSLHKIEKQALIQKLISQERNLMRNEMMDEGSADDTSIDAGDQEIQQQQIKQNKKIKKQSKGITL